MTERDVIHQYLKSLSKYLSRLEKADADEVIREIESHIFDRIETMEESGEHVDANLILEGFGNPRDLASQYVEHILEGAKPPAGFRAIQRVKTTVTKTMFFSTGFIGYGMALFLLITGMAKLFMPEKVGVWVAEHGESLILSFSGHALTDSNELLGYWLIPIAIVAGLIIFRLTQRLMAVLRQNR